MHLLIFIIFSKFEEEEENRSMLEIRKNWVDWALEDNGKLGTSWKIKEGKKV